MPAKMFTSAPSFKYRIACSAAPTPGTALDADWLYDNREDAAAVQRAMVENAAKLLVIADSSKIGNKAFCKSFPAEKISVLITNFSKESGPAIAELKRKKIRVVMI